MSSRRKISLFSLGFSLSRHFFFGINFMPDSFAARWIQECHRENHDDDGDDGDDDDDDGDDDDVKYDDDDSKKFLYL